jgi:serine/threonine protein kinase
MDDLIARLTARLAGRYTIDREIGRGGMGTVFLAHDLRHRRKVAIKALHTPLASAIGPERFLREIEIVAGLNHPHILPLHDSGDAGGILYYVMPFVGGESLREKTQRERQLPIEQALRLTREVADALAYAHEHRVIHRDIKPSNILLESGHAVVTDFGVALTPGQDAAERLTSSGFSIGTPLYMSPEQASGERDLDGRSDIYSLGCVLYEMLCGDPPFAGYNRQVILARKMAGAVSSPRIVRESLCDAVERVTLTALARNAADRFPNATAFVRALDDAALQQRAMISPSIPVQTPITAKPAEPATAPTSPWRIGIGILLLVSITGLITSTVHDVKMQLPPEFVPSRWDFPILGLRALIPALLFLFGIIAAFVVLKYGARLIVALLRRAGLRDTIEKAQRKATDTLTRMRRNVEPVMVAELFFIGAIVVSIPVLLVCGAFLPDLWTDRTQGLAQSQRADHNEFTFAMTILILGLAILWRHIFPAGKARRGGTSVQLARWGSLAWIIALILIVTAPWRTLWDNARPRVRVDGNRAYIVLERDSDLVIYDADRNETRVLRTSEPITLQRLGTVGYVFEGARQFDRSLPQK